MSTKTDEDVDESPSDPFDVCELIPGLCQEPMVTLPDCASTFWKYTGDLPPAPHLDPELSGILGFPTCVRVTTPLRFRQVFPPAWGSPGGTPCSPRFTSDGQALVWNEGTKTCGVWLDNSGFCSRQPNDGSCQRVFAVPECPGWLAYGVGIFGLGDYISGAGFLVNGNSQEGLESFAGTQPLQGFQGDSGFIVANRVAAKRAPKVANVLAKVSGWPVAIAATVPDLYCMTAGL